MNVTFYKYSLDANLAQVVEIMKDHVTALGLDSSFRCNENRSQTVSRLVNKTSLELTEETVNDALQRFTDATGIPMVIVVDDMDRVFGSGNQSKADISAISVLNMVLAVGLAALVIWLVVRALRKRKGRDQEDEQRTYTGPELD